MLLLAVGGLRVMDGTMSIGMLIAFLGMMQNFFQPISNLVNLGSDLQEMDAELLRFEARESLERQVMQETLAELASVLPQPKLNRLSSSSEFSTSIDANHPDRALLVAAGAVGRALGVEIRPPAASEDVKRVQDPVEAIARIQ